MFLLAFVGLSYPPPKRGQWKGRLGGIECLSGMPADEPDRAS